MTRTTKEQKARQEARKVWDAIRKQTLQAGGQVPTYWSQTLGKFVTVPE